LRADDTTECQVQPGSEPVSVNKAPGGWRVIVPKETIDARLHLSTIAIDGSHIRVPLLIPMPKLRWGLAAEHRSGILQMGRNLITRSIDKLLQSGNASIHVDMYGLGGMLHSLRLRLVEIGETEEVRREVKFSSTDFSPDRLRAGLDQFSDPIAHINSLAVFELTWQKDYQSELVRIPLLELSRELEISDVSIELETEASCAICWSEEHPLKNRRVMIQPCWQPWQVPLEYKIPDSARRKFKIQGISLPRTAYLLYFYITPTWGAIRTTPPDNIQPHTVLLCQPRERLTDLCIENGTDDEQFRRKIESSAILSWTGDQDKSGEMLTSAARHMFRLTNLDLLLGTMKWMQKQKADPSGYRSFFLKRMFNNQLINSMLDKYPANDPRVVEYLQFTELIQKSIPAETARLLLERVDVPVAVYQSLRVLLIHKDNNLASILVKMLGNDRLTMRDVQALLADDDPLKNETVEDISPWMLEQVALLASDRVSDELLAIMLIKTAQMEKFKEDSRLMDWIVRALPYVEDEQLLFAYLQILFLKNTPNVIHLLLDLLSKDKVMEDQAFSLFSINPKQSLEILERLPNSPGIGKYVQKLETKYPSVAGIISVGARLKTPVGLSIIESITDKSNNTVHQIRLNSESGILSLKTSNLRDNIRYNINLDGLVLVIPGEKEAWRCRFCGGIHPEQRAIMGHRHGPGNTAFSKALLPLSISINDIEILN
jgi:hypothetical protein